MLFAPPAGAAAAGLAASAGLAAAAGAEGGAPAAAGAAGAVVAAGAAGLLSCAAGELQAASAAAPSNPADAPRKIRRGEFGVMGSLLIWALPALSGGADGGCVKSRWMWDPTARVGSGTLGDDGGPRA